MSSTESCTLRKAHVHMPYSQVTRPPQQGLAFGT